MPSHPITHPAATRELRRRLPAGVVRVDAASRKAASFDSSKLFFPAEAVVFARTPKDIGVVLEIANRHRVPVTVRGRGTTNTGSAAPRRGGWVVDMLKLNSVRIDPEAGLAFVGAGAKVASIQDKAEAAGWFYPPDPSSRVYCTIGGNIACNAGGMHGGKYGVTRDFILALKGFLPTGEFVAWGTATRKFSAGFNLRDLWIGSEGMLGIVTEATLKLIPKPAARWTLLTAFESEVSAIRAARRLFSGRHLLDDVERRPLIPAICEFLDRYSVACAEAVAGRPIFRGQAGRPVILIELAGSAGEIASDKKVVLAWARKHAVAHQAARNRREAEELWEVRRKCSGAMFQMGDSKLNEDVVIPLRSYERFARFLEGLRRSSKLPIPTFGHLADGNLHVNIMYHRDVPAECRAAERAVGLLMREVVKLGGAISGEHGIGLAKSPFLRIQHSPAQVRAMLAVKKALDPRGILNPGKIFEPFEVWRHKRIEIRLPWDH